MAGHRGWREADPVEHPDLEVEARLQLRVHPLQELRDWAPPISTITP